MAKVEKEKQIEITCGTCGRSAWSSKVKDWRISDAGAVCGDCVKSTTYVRTVTLSIYGPASAAQNDWLNKTRFAGSRGRCPLHTWESLRKALETLWTQAANAKNYVYRELMKLDPLVPGSEKLPTFKLASEQGKALYRSVVTLFPQISPGVLSQVMRVVQDKYFTDRFDVWRGAKSGSTFAAPQPHHQRKAETEFMTLPDGQIAVRLVLGPEKDTEEGKLANAVWLIIKGTLSETRDAVKHRFAVETLRKVAAGKMEFGSPMFVPRISRHLGSPRTDVLMRLPVEFPREAGVTSDKPNVLYAATANTGFLFARFENSGMVWFSNQDHMKERETVLQSISRRHDFLMRRLSQDSKAEMRSNGRVNRLASRMARLSEVNDNRKKTFLQQQAAMLVAFARRRNVTHLVLDTSNHGFFGDKFDYCKFEAQVRQASGRSLEVCRPEELAKVREYLSGKRGKDREEYRAKTFAEIRATLDRLREMADGKTEEKLE